MIKFLSLITFAFFSFQSFAQTDLLIDSLLHKNVPSKKIVLKSATDSFTKKNIQSKLLVSDSLENKNISSSADKSNSSSLILNDSSIKNSADSFQSTKIDSAGIDSFKNTLVPSKPPLVKVSRWKQDTMFSNLFKINFNK